MSRRGRGGLGLLVAAALLLGAASGAASGAAPRPLELPAPSLVVTVTPVPLGVTRPALELPPPPAVSAPPVEPGAVPLPRFITTVPKPLPVVRDPGAFSCVFVAFRRAATLAECGVHRMLLGEVSEAREALEESIAIDPRGPQAGAAYVWLGEVALREGRYDQAERRYRAALPLGLPPELAVHAELGLGWLALRRGDVVEAERALAQALGYVPPQPVALVARFLDGIARLAAGRPAEAISAWEDVASSGAPAPMAVELFYWRGAALARLGDWGRALESLDRFLAAVPSGHPVRPDAIVQAGWVALARGAPEEAERRFLLADSAGPRPEVQPLLWAGLVRAYLALGDAPRASEVGRRLEVGAPGDPLVAPALLSIGEAAVSRGALREALAVYRRLLNLPLAPPVQDYVRYRLGEVAELDNQPEEAKNHYRTLRDRGKDEGIAQRASYRLGLLALRERDPAAARREGEALLRAGAVPELRELALLLAAEGAARGGDPNRAVTLLRVALRELPDSPRAGRSRLALGWALLDDGEPETALREWRELARTPDPETAALARLALADVALRQGHEAEALAALRALGTAAAAGPWADLIALDHGILAVRANADEEAVQVLDPLVLRIPDFPRQALLRRALGIARYRLRQYDLAERQFQQAARVAPAEPSGWLGAGLAALAQNRLAEADLALEHARVGAAAEVGAVASYGLVLVAVQRGDTAAFRERAAGFVDRYPGHALAPPVLYGLVVATADHGELDQADGWVRRLARDHPQSAYVDDALLRLGVAAAGSRPELARRAYGDLLARRPAPERRAEAWLGVADAALALGDGADAQRAVAGFLGEASPADPQVARAQVLLVRAYEAQGQRERALGATETFLARFADDPLAPGVQLARGRLLVEARQWDAAAVALMVARDRGDPAVAAPASYFLGEALAARGDHQGAIAAHLGATYLYPGTPWAAQGLKGAAQSYLALQMSREAAIVLRKLTATPGVDPALAQWARQALAQLGPSAAEEPRLLSKPRPPASP